MSNQCNISEALNTFKINTGHILKRDYQQISGISHSSLGNPHQDRQRFVDAVVLISIPDWFETLSNFVIVVETPFEFGLRKSNYARFFQTEDRS